MSVHAENECVSDKSYEICLEQQCDEFKTIVLYRNNKVIGTWHNLISNHDTPMTREWYYQAQLHIVKVRRTISRNILNRAKVNELLALYAGASKK